MAAILDMLHCGLGAGCPSQERPFRGGLTMFAPPVAKPKALRPQRSTVVAQRPSQSAVSQMHLLQQSIGNQAVLRLLAQRATATRNVPGTPEKENDAAPTAAQAAAPS